MLLEECEVLRLVVLPVLAGRGERAPGGVGVVVQARVLGVKLVILLLGTGQLTVVLKKKMTLLPLYQK